jgi:hypothetical protein
MDDVDVEFDWRTYHYGTGEHGVRRPNRLVVKPFRHRDDRLREHLRAFHHLPFVGSGDPGSTGEAVRLLGPHIEQVEKAGNRPMRLFRFRRHLASVTFSPNLVKPYECLSKPTRSQLASITRVRNRSMVSVACATLSPGNPTCSQVTPSAASFSIPVR